MVAGDGAARRGNKNHLGESRAPKASHPLQQGFRRLESAHPWARHIYGTARPTILAGHRGHPATMAFIGRCTLFDKYLVRKDSLQNVAIGGKVAGFRFAVRNSNYRGTFVSLHNGYYLVIDGTLFPRETQSFQVNGKPPRSFDEIRNAGYEHWDFDDEAWVYVDLPGGLAEGPHTIVFKQAIFAAYGYFSGHEDYIDNPPVPGPETRHFLIMDKTFNPVTYELVLGDRAVVEAFV